ncbi:response regulator transcription factor [Helicovermis profundi]|uniref:Stage 0 sporulation protein A homolog n=1 Tax=Helicovermis profundi TaxID=3065157 RepID=A0AAU9E6P7_9FIRM|nr:response regulator transcription factor [Clostridia bacterium S502]
MNFNILIVEDQKEISSIVVKYLIKESYNTFVAENGFEALELFSRQSFHLVLLDVMMPGIDGFEVLKEIRNISEVPVIMLTAREAETDRIKGFDFGADDYVVKPFSPRELVRRIKVVFRRLYNETDEIVLQVENLKLYTKSMKLQKDGEYINITSTEFQLLHTFIKNKGLVLSREQLIEKSFGYDYDGFDRNIDTYIKRLRQKIEDNPKKPKYLVTKYGVGYIFGGM